MNTTNNGEQPSEGNPFGGDTEQVRAGLYAALVEALLRFLADSVGGADAKATRKANGYMKKDALKMGKLVSMARFVGINARKVTPLDLLKTGLMQVRGLIVNGQPMTVNITDGLMAKALEANAAVRRAAAAWMAFHQWEAADLAKRQDMVSKSGQDIIEVPEGHTPATQEALAAFGLKEGSFVRHVVIEAAAMLRESFVALKEKLNGVSIINAANIRTLNENGTATHLDADEDAHLMLNIHTVMAWFATRVFATARYCGVCKKAKEARFNFGNQQVKTAGNKCPQCGTPAAQLGRNSNTAHLPYITTAQKGLKVIGGWRVAMTSFIMPKVAFNALNKARLGLMPVEDAFTVLMNSRVDVRIQRDGRTQKEKARLVPVCYEMQGQTGGFELSYGLALEPIHIGDDN